MKEREGRESEEKGDGEREIKGKQEYPLKDEREWLVVFSERVRGSFLLC